MNIFLQVNSDPFPLGSDSQSADTQETSSLSDDQRTRRATQSDEEVILASDRPKKRAGRKKFRETRHPVYRGIRRRNSNRWVCELREPNKKTRIWLGTYPTAEMAARAHDVAALALRGQLACLNFADSIWRLPVPVSKNARDIQSAAAEAAEAFRPPEFGGVSGDHDVTQEIVKASDDAASSSSDRKPENVAETSLENVAKTSPENVLYMDEEAEFDMPGLLINMAEGLLLSPPSYMEGSFNWDDMESDHAHVPLWNYSI